MEKNYNRLLYTFTITTHQHFIMHNVIWFHSVRIQKFSRMQLGITELLKKQRLLATRYNVVLKWTSEAYDLLIYARTTVEFLPKKARRSKDYIRTPRHSFIYSRSFKNWCKALYIKNYSYYLYKWLFKYKFVGKTYYLRFYLF